MPITGQGSKLHIRRESGQTRNGRRRTIGTYQIFQDGNPRQELSGTSVEIFDGDDDDFAVV